jgi:hypothetical protein
MLSQPLIQSRDPRGSQCILGNLTIYCLIIVISTIIFIPFWILYKSTDLPQDFNYTDLLRYGLFKSIASLGIMIAIVVIFAVLFNFIINDILCNCCYIKSVIQFRSENNNPTECVENRGSDFTNSEV